MAEQKVINIQQADDADLLDICALMDEIDAGDWYYKDEKDFIKEHFTKRGFILKAETGNYSESELAGFFLIRFPMLDADNLGTYLEQVGEQYKPEQIVHMESVAVKRGYNGLGIMSRLMDACLEKIAKDYPNCKYAMATVHPDNRYSLENFLKAGFAVITETNKYNNSPRKILYKKI